MKSKLKGLTKQLVLAEIYSENFRINSCGPTDSPLALYAPSPVDGLRDLWPYRRRLDDFMLYEVGKHMNCSFNEFIDQPRETVLHVLDTLKKRIAEANAKAAELNQKLKNSKPKGDPDSAYLTYGPDR